LKELKHRYWAYVPDDYNPNYAYSLLVWIHPSGQPQEAQMLNALRQHCDERGMILLAPLANEEEGWSNEEFEFINELMQIFRDRYSLDPWRTVVLSAGDSSRFAAQLAFRQTDRIAGLALLNSLLATAPPDAEPGKGLSFFFGATSDFPRAAQLEKIVQKLKELKHEALLKTSESEGKDQIPADILGQLAIWIDSLKRI
ncbi:MAG: hypothetical protein CMJ46_12325, partial [Planctomyces sp.]|nr:hypothetical protein [Planctomyces sp.]